MLGGARAMLALRPRRSPVAMPNAPTLVRLGPAAH